MFEHERKPLFAMCALYAAAALIASATMGCVSDANRGDGDGGGGGGGTIIASGSKDPWGGKARAANDAAFVDPDACGTPGEVATLELMNDEREGMGLNRLGCEIQMVDVAREHSQDMIDRGYFDHTNPEGEQPWDRMARAGVNGWYSVGENIAAGQKNAPEVHGAWMNSPGHRANILHPDWTHAVVGAVESEDGVLFWTQMFAKF